MLISQKHSATKCSFTVFKKGLAYVHELISLLLLLVHALIKIYRKLTPCESNMDFGLNFHINSFSVATFMHAYQHIILP